jgi:tRNA A37 N6-isopentenylltransferase MiaA
MCIYQGLKSLESDVSVLMSDCSSLDPVRQNEMTMSDLNQAFRSLDIIYTDLKTVRKEIDESFTTEKKIEALEIDWAKFNKNVARIQNDLQQK